MSIEGTPYIVFGNDTLGKLPALKIGDEIACDKCYGRHAVFGAKDEHGRESDAVLAYHCGSKLFLAGLGGRNVTRRKPDASGVAEIPETREWIFTFGFGHVHPVSGEPLANCFVRIRAESSDAARDKMEARFGLKWSIQYDSEEAAGVTRYRLREIEYGAA